MIVDSKTNHTEGSTVPPCPISLRSPIFWPFSGSLRPHDRGPAAKPGTPRRGPVHRRKPQGHSSGPGRRLHPRFPFALHNRPHHTRTSVFARLVGPRYFPDFVRLILPRHFPRFLSPIVSPFVPINLQFIVCIFFSYDCTNSLTKFMSKF